MARVKFDLGDCLGYTYNGQTYSAKELFDKLRTGELKTLIAQGKVTLSKDQAPTVVEEYVKKEVVKATRRPKVGSSDEEVMSEYLLNQPVYYRLRNGDKITQSIALVEDYIKENGKIAFIKLQNVDTPIPLNDVSKTKLRSLKEKGSKEVVFPIETRLQASYNNGLGVTNAINKSNAGVITFVAEDKLKEKGWDKNSVARFQKSLKRAFQNSKLGDKAFKGKIQVVLMDNKTILDWLTFNNPAQAEFIRSNKLALKGTYVSNQPGLIILNTDKASPTTPLHEAVGHMWERWAGGAPTLIFGGRKTISQEREEAESLESFLFPKKKEVVYVGGNATNLHQLAMNKVAQTNLYKFLEIAGKILTNHSYNGDALFNIVKSKNEELYKSLNLDDSEIKEYMQYLYQSGYTLSSKAAYEFAMATIRSEVFAKTIETNGQSLAKSDKSVVEFFRDLINEIYEAVVKIAGFKTLTAKDLASMSIDKFSQTVIAEVFNEDLSTDIKRKAIELAPGQVSLKEELSERIGIGVKADGDFVDEDNFDDTYQEAETEEGEKIAAPEKIVELTDKTERLLEEKAARDYDNLTIDDVTKESTGRRKIAAYMLIRNSPEEVIKPLIDILIDSDSYKQVKEQTPNLSIEDYLDGVMVGKYPLTNVDRKKIGTAQKGPLYQFYKYHAEHITDNNTKRLTDKIGKDKEQLAALEEQMPKKKRGKKSAEEQKTIDELNKKIDKVKKSIEKNESALEEAKGEGISAEELFDKVKKEWVRLNESMEMDRIQKTVDEKFEQALDKKGKFIFDKINKAYAKLAKAKTPEEKAKIRQEIDGYSASYMDAFNPSTMMSIGNLFHISAAEFERFQHQYIGTGEGMQAFGWGTYLTNAESVKEHYLKALKRRGYEIKGIKYQYYSPVAEFLNENIFDTVDNRIAYYMANWGAKQVINFNNGVNISYDALTEDEKNKIRRDIELQYKMDKAEADRFGGFFEATKMALGTGFISTSKYLSEAQDELDVLLDTYQVKKNTEDSYFLLTDIQRVQNKITDLNNLISGITSGQIKEKDIKEFNDPLYQYNVTLHNGKSPVEYQYIEYDMPMSEQNKNNVQASLSSFDPTYLEFSQVMNEYKNAGIEVTFVNPVETMSALSTIQFDRKTDGKAVIESIKLPSGETLYSPDLDGFFDNTELQDIRPYLDTVAQVWADINSEYTNPYSNTNEKVSPKTFDAYLSVKNYLKGKINASPSDTIVVNGVECTSPYKAASMMFLQSNIDGFVYPAEYMEGQDVRDENRRLGKFNYTVFDDNAPAIDSRMMMSVMANATNPNGYFEVLSTNEDEEGVTISTYDYKNELNQSTASLEVTKNFKTNTASISFITKNKNVSDIADTTEAFVKMSKMLQMEGLTPVIDNYVNGYGYEFFNKLADQNLLIKNDLVDEIDELGDKNKQHYYPIPPFAYNFDGEFSVDNIGNGFNFGQSVEAMGPDMMYSITGDNIDKQPQLTEEQFAMLDDIAESYRDTQPYVKPNFEQVKEESKNWFGKVSNWFTNKLMPAQGIGEKYIREQEKLSGYIAKQNRELQKDINKWTDVLTTPEFISLPQFKNLTKESIAELVHLALAGDVKAMAMMPYEVAEMIKQGRNRISGMQEQMIRSGFVKPSTATIIEASKGTYLTRGYRKFLSKYKIYKNSVTDEQINNALEGFYIWAKDGLVKEKQMSVNVVPISKRWKRFDALVESILKSNMKLNVINNQIINLEQKGKPSDKLDELRKNKAILEREIASSQQTAIDQYKSLDADTKDLAQEALNELMADPKEGKKKMLNGYNGNQIQLQTLKRRLDETELPTWMRDVLGEIKDPLLSYQLTVTNLTKMTGRIAYLNNVYKLAINDGHALKGTDLNATQKRDLANKGWVAINGLNGHTTQTAFGPFIGTYVSPQLYKQAFGDDLGISSVYMYRSFVTIGKTAGNIFFGPIRNMMGNKGFLMLNGSFSKIISNALGGTFKKENDYIKSLAKSKTTKAYKDALNEYWKGVTDDAELLGVVTNVNSGAIKEMFTQFHNNPSLIKKLQDGDEEGFMNIYKNYLIPGWQKTRDFATESYIMADILPKVFAFNIQRNHLANRVYGMSFQELKQKSKNQAFVNTINEMAASHINQTMVSEHRVAPLVANMTKEKPWYKEIPTFVFGGDFPRFKAEVFRIFVTNIASVAKKHDTYSPNTVLYLDEKKNSDMIAKLNNEERAHTIGGLALWSNAAAQMMGMYGAVSAGLLGMAGLGQGGDDDDKNELEAETNSANAVQSPNTYGKLNENTGIWDKNAGMLSEMTRLYQSAVDGGMSMDEALREFAPEFMRNHELGFNLSGDGKAEYYDKGTVDPFSSVMALGRGFMYRPEQGWNNKVTGYLGSTFEEIFGQEMVVSAVVALIKNEDYKGSKIYDNTDALLGQKGFDALKYATLQLSPAVVGSVMRTYKNTQDVENYKGDITKEGISLPASLAKEAIGAATGRTYNIDNPGGVLQNSLFRLNKLVEQERYEEKKEDNVKRVLLSMNRKVQAMRTLGLPEDEIVMAVGKTIRSNDIRMAVYMGGQYIDNIDVLSKEERKELYKQLK
jgi:hypothetical protein